MAGDVDICNLALSHLGEEAEVVAIAPPDGTSQAAQCGRFYPIARNALLEMHPWTFATTRVALAVVDGAELTEWAFAYAVPVKCVKVLQVLRPDALEDSRGEDYIIESAEDGTKIIFTNVESATLRYVRLVEDTTKFTPGFTNALGRLLASYLAGPIIKGTTGVQVAQAQLKVFAIELANAKVQDSNAEQRSNYRDRRSSTEIARGGPWCDWWRSGPRS